MRFLNRETLEAIHARLIETYGGSHGLRDSSLLQSAVDRPENRFNYEPGSSVARLAASLGWALIKNHVFVDGNKRIGLAAVLVFLRANGCRLSCNPSEAEVVTLRAAAGEITEAEWTAWLEGAVEALPASSL